MPPKDTTPAAEPEPLEPTEDAIAAPSRRGVRPLVYERTWELELLVSGAVAFTLLQVPGAVDNAFSRLSLQLGPALYETTVYAYIYIKIILYALISSFIVHLSARAYWVGLVGLSSVFPEGVQWERTKLGPNSQRFLQERLPTLPELTARVDRFCSILFSFASVIVLTFVSSTIIVVVGGGIAYLASEHLFGISASVIFYTIILILIVPMLLAHQVDRRWGNRMGPRGQRLVRFAIRWMYWSQLGSLTASISNTLFTNIDRKKSVTVFYLAFAALLAFFLVRDVMIRMNGDGPDGYIYLPHEIGEATVAARYYEDARGGRIMDHRFPSVQSDIIRDPFVRLFLPYNPRRHTALVAERCPDAAQPLAPEESDDQTAVARRDAALISCIADMQPITLNGEPLDGLRFMHYRRPDSGAEGLLAYIPTAGLPPGENLLVIQSAPPPASERDEEDLDPPHYIRFWIGD